MPRTKANIEEADSMVIEPEKVSKPANDPTKCHCGATRYIYGKSMDAFNVTIVYKCPDCGSTETVIEKLE